MAIKRIGVIGSGTMGGGIAQVAAQSGFEVLLFDVSEEMLKKATSQIDNTLKRSVAKERIKKTEAEAAIQRITITVNLQDCAKTDFVIEAAPEKLEVKQSIFREMDERASAKTIFATNTSTLSVTEIGAATQRADRVVGMHFFNPPPALPLVEVVGGAETTEKTVHATMELAKKMGKTPVRAKDTPGFIVNRIARPFYLEGLRLLAEGAADHATIDRVVRDGGKFRMGPFELMDLIGLDINFAASQSVYNAYFQEPRFRPSLLQQKMVESGRLGRKTAKGWYDYTE